MKRIQAGIDGDDERTEADAESVEPEAEQQQRLARETVEPATDL
ncbi:MAG: hypothetical protein ACKN89_06815 [Cyanobium sp.]|nr:hypothetical protein [Synechococcaceae cyanobacterium]